MATKHGQQYYGMYQPAPLGEMKLFGGMNAYIGGQRSKQGKSGGNVSKGGDATLNIAGTPGNLRALTVGIEQYSSVRDRAWSEMYSVLENGGDMASAEFKSKLMIYQEASLKVNELELLIPASANALKLAEEVRKDIIDNGAGSQLHFRKGNNNDLEISLTNMLNGGVVTVGQQWEQAYNTPTISQGTFGVLQLETPELPEYYTPGRASEYFIANGQYIRGALNKSASNPFITAAQKGGIGEVFWGYNTYENNIKALASFRDNVYTEMPDDVKREVADVSYRKVNDRINNYLSTGVLSDGNRIIKDYTAEIDKSKMSREEKDRLKKNNKSNLDFETNWYESIKTYRALQNEIMQEEKEGITVSEEKRRQRQSDMMVLENTIDSGYKYFGEIEMHNYLDEQIKRMEIVKTTPSYSRMQEYGSSGSFNKNEKRYVDKITGSGVPTEYYKNMFIDSGTGLVRTGYTKGYPITDSDYNMDGWKIPYKQGITVKINGTNKIVPAHLIIRNPGEEKVLNLQNGKLANILHLVGMTDVSQLPLPDIAEGQLTGQLPRMTLWHNIVMNSGDIMSSVANLAKDNPDMTGQDMVFEITKQVQQRYREYYNRDATALELQGIRNTVERQAGIFLKAEPGGRVRPKTPEEFNATAPVVQSYVRVKFKIYEDEVDALDRETRREVLGLSNIRGDHYTVKKNLNHLEGYKKGNTVSSYSNNWQTETVGNVTRKYRILDAQVPAVLFEGMQNKTIAEKFASQDASELNTILEQKIDNANR